MTATTHCGSPMRSMLRSPNTASATITARGHARAYSPAGPAAPALPLRSLLLARRCQRAGDLDRPGRGAHRLANRRCLKSAIRILQQEWLQARIEDHRQVSTSSLWILEHSAASRPAEPIRSHGAAALQCCKQHEWSERPEVSGTVQRKILRQSAQG